VRIDPKATAVDLSRAAKQWQSLGEAKITEGRNQGDRDGLHRLSSLLDAIGPLRKSQAHWIEVAGLMREVGGANDRSAAVADQQAKSCASQIGFCGESFHELVMERAFDKEHPPNLAEIRIAAYEFERNADSRPIEWLISQFLQDPALGNRESWGENLDLWWFSQVSDS
jgi:hypothetical protein